MIAETVFTLPLNLTDNHLASKSSHIKVLAMALNIETITNRHGHRVTLLREAGREGSSIRRKQSPTSALVAKVPELFVPVLAVGRPETPDSGMRPDEAGGRFITSGIEPAPDAVHPQGPDPLGKAGCRTGGRDHVPEVGQFRQGDHPQGIDGTFDQQGRSLATDSSRLPSFPSSVDSSPSWRGLFTMVMASFWGEYPVLENLLWRSVRPTVDLDAFQEMGEQACNPFKKKMYLYGSFLGS